MYNKKRAGKYSRGRRQIIEGGSGDNENSRIDEESEDEHCDAKLDDGIFEAELNRIK